MRRCKTYPLHHILQQLPRIPSPLGARLRAQVNQVPGIMIPLAQDLRLGVMQERDHLVEVTLPTLDRQLIVEPPGSAAKQHPPAIKIVTRW